MSTFLLLCLVFFMVTGVAVHAVASAITQSPGWKKNEAPECAVGCLSIAYALLAYGLAAVSFVVLLVRLN